MEALSKPSSLTKQLMDEGPFAFPFEHHDALCPGMTLRDYFAAKAMVGLMAEYANSRYGVSAEPYGPSHDEFNAQAAYRIADAMLAARGAQ